MSSLKHWIFGTIVCLCCLAVHGREECEHGKYGDACIRNCSQGCKPFSNNEVRCHKETGECYEGCKVGVYGNLCDQPCSSNCKNRTCIQQNGHCAFGCIENHIGDFCETSQEITVVHQGTTYSSHTTVTTGVAQTSSFKVIILAVTGPVLILVIIVVAVVIYRWRKKRMEGASDPNEVEEGLRPSAPDPDKVEERLLPGAPDPDKDEERLLPGAPDPDKVEERLLPGAPDPDKDEERLLPGAPDPDKDEERLLPGAPDPDKDEERLLPGAPDPDKDEERLLPGAPDPDKDEERLLPGAPDPDKDEERLLPDAPDPDKVDERLLPDASDPNEVEEGLRSVETANTEMETGEDHEDTDEDTGEGRGVDDDQEDEDSEEDSGDTRINLADIKTAPQKTHLAVFVTVVDRNEIEMRNNKQQFMAEVADKTSAVDICVTNRKLFDKFKVNSGLILTDVDWSGNVLFVNEKSKATKIKPIEIDPTLAEESFGRGKVVSIKEALAITPKSWVALKGKIVKQSVLSKRYSYEKLLTHRQIKLKDRSGSVYVDVWEGEAVNLRCGDVIHMTGCKRKKSKSVDESSVTTTRKTFVKKLGKTEFDDINIARGFTTGTLEAIEVEMYKSCPKQGCYLVKLHENNVCESCESTVSRPVRYANADVIVTTPRNKIRALNVFWPQLRQLYGLFGVEISLQRDTPTIQDDFRHLHGKTVKYQTCGTVREFRL